MGAVLGDMARFALLPAVLALACAAPAYPNDAEDPYLAAAIAQAEDMWADVGVTVPERGEYLIGFATADQYLELCPEAGTSGCTVYEDGAIVLPPHVPPRGLAYVVAHELGHLKRDRRGHSHAETCNAETPADMMCEYHMAGVAPTAADASFVLR